MSEVGGATRRRLCFHGSTTATHAIQPIRTRYHDYSLLPYGRYTIGNGSVVSFVLLTTLQAALFPITQTSLAILACHPSVQCDFPLCYNSPGNQMRTAALGAALNVAVHFRGCGVCFRAAAMADAPAALIMLSQLKRPKLLHLAQFVQTCKDTRMKKVP